jgi:hypothetical protein
MTLWGPSEVSMRQPLSSAAQRIPNQRRSKLRRRLVLPGALPQRCRLGRGGSVAVGHQTCGCETRSHTRTNGLRL